MDRLSEKRRWIAWVSSERLRDRHDANAEPLAEHLLVASRLDLVPRER
jgi:hypothetical protein